MTLLYLILFLKLIKKKNIFSFNLTSMVPEPIMLEKNQISSYSLCSNMLEVPRENAEIVTSSMLALPESLYYLLLVIAY